MGMGEAQPFKILIEIKGGLYDLSFFKQITKSEKYSEKEEGMIYLIVINGKANELATFYDTEIEFATEDMRDKELEKLKSKLKNFDFILIL